jgi:dethiobiotin synthetase
MTRPVLVTGTDTGVGKTVVSRAILRLLSNAGREPTPLKLIETGLIPAPDGSLVPEDGAALALAARTSIPADVTAPFRFRLAAAPSTAARAEGTVLGFDDLLRAIDRLPRERPLLLEGAGGLLVPIGPDGSFADLARVLRARLAVVARHTLGTLNHTLLTLEVARARGLDVAAVVLNRTPAADDLPHADELRRLADGIPILGPLGFYPNATDDELAEALTREVADLGTVATWFR